MPVADEIYRKLNEAFSPDTLEVVNDSASHAGHSGDDGTGETHFNVIIRAPAFATMGRLQRHRAVHAAIGADLMGRIHALALDIE
ncbi:BolA family protein [Pseudorhodobacter aquimaris]|uniref:BolA family protein n=1 Tax=Pseudorhodobacter aquimaris TaxID=687412 RepID=UPI00067B6790|nr:BolA family protein [Pseudorhodobacter aquimaris]